MAKSHVVADPFAKVLVVGSDILKYTPETSGEPTQGGAAVALVVGTNPQIATLEQHSGIHTVDVMDFWRPLEEKEALFDGKLSAQNYLTSLGLTFNRYLEKSHIDATAIERMCFHAPFGKMAIKACARIFDAKTIGDTLIYNEIMGNSCSASLYICLLSLLDNSQEDLSGKRVGLYSYGSGSVAEYFSCIIEDSYASMLTAEANRKMLENRIELPFDEYENLYCSRSPAPDQYRRYENIGFVTLSAIKNGQRIYERQ
jgi:hydroxymethylglutaryl-CoA synthase